VMIMIITFDYKQKIRKQKLWCRGGIICCLHM
jgi:hypothetical protein